MNALNKFSGIVHWLPRLALAAIFLYHGAGKYPVTQGMANMMGMPVFMIYLLAAGEIAGAFLLLWGGFGPDWSRRLAGAISSVVMLRAIFMVHLSHVWNSINMGGGNEGKGLL